MTSTPFKTTLIASTLMLSLAALPSARAADSTVGETVPTSGSVCNRGPLTVLQSQSSGPSYSVPSNGVITSVHMSGDPDAPAPRGFRLGRRGQGVWTITGATDTVTIPAGETVTQHVRIPAEAGDVLGEYVADGTTKCLVPAGSTDELAVFYSDPAPGSPTPASATGPGYRISVSATLEPDADHDGFGDTTQDLCPTDPSAQGPCKFHLGTVASLSGRARVGRKLHAPSIAGLPATATETFQWFRVTRRHHHVLRRPITGAHAAQYLLSKKDRGSQVFVQIALTATNYVPLTISSSPRRVR